MKLEYIFALAVMISIIVGYILTSIENYIGNRRAEVRQQAIKKVCKRVRSVDAYAEFVAIADAYRKGGM